MPLASEPRVVMCHAEARFASAAQRCGVWIGLCALEREVRWLELWVRGWQAPGVAVCGCLHELTHGRG